MRVLLLEVGSFQRQVAIDWLRSEGHLVEPFERLHDINPQHSATYDVLLVSSHLPDGSGLTWVRTLRSRGIGTATVMLSDVGRHADRMKAALDAGADDCMLTPFDPVVLAARVRSLRYRIAGLASPNLQRGDVELDLLHRDIRRGGEHVGVTAREWNLIEALALRADRIVPKAELELLVHGRDAVPSSNALEVHLSHLRRKLGRDLIKTVRGVGYRLVPAAN